jgi:hypothetical protein
VFIHPLEESAYAAARTRVGISFAHGPYGRCKYWVRTMGRGAHAVICALSVQDRAFVDHGRMPGPAPSLPGRSFKAAAPVRGLSVLQSRGHSVRHLIPRSERISPAARWPSSAPPSM